MSILEPLLSLGQAIDQERVVSWVRDFGWTMLLVFSFVEVVPPVSFLSPGGLILIAAGALIDDPTTGASFFLASWVGFMLGNLFFYRIGARYGRDIAHRLWLTEHRLKYVDDFMARYGRISVLLGQSVGGVRPFVSFVAGTAGTPSKTFLISMVIGTALWSGLLLTAGSLLRAHLKLLLSGVGIFSTLLFLGSVLFVVRAEHTLLQEKREHTRKENP